MKHPIFGLSTTPVKDIKSELQKEIERSQMVIYYMPRQHGTIHFRRTK